MVLLADVDLHIGQQSALAIPVPLPPLHLRSPPRTPGGNANSAPLQSCNIAPSSSFTVYKRIDSIVPGAAKTLTQMDDKSPSPVLTAPVISALTSPTHSDYSIIMPGSINMQQRNRLMMPRQMPLMPSAQFISGANSQFLPRASDANQNRLDGSFSSFSTTKIEDIDDKSSKRRRLAAKRTRVACLPCALSKSACHAQRPCTRCIRLNMVDQCVNRVHRKMGRPRQRPSKRLLNFNRSSQQALERANFLSTPQIVSYALWTSWKPSIIKCYMQQQSLPSYWVNVLQKFLIEDDSGEYMSLRARGIDTDEKRRAEEVMAASQIRTSGETGLVCGVTPGRFEHVPVPILDLEFHDGDVCSFTMNSYAEELFGRNHLCLQRLLRYASPNVSIAVSEDDDEDFTTDALFQIFCASGWSFIFDIIRDICFGIKDKFSAIISIKPQEGMSVQCLTTVRCMRSSDQRISSIFIMFLPMPAVK